MEIVVAIIVGLILLLAVGGAIANARRQKENAGNFRAHLDEVNRALADAHAEDKGWEPNALQAAARRFFEQERPGAEIKEMSLVQVIDRPGTDEDHAVFRFVTSDGEARLTLGRSGGEWISQGLS